MKIHIRLRALVYAMAFAAFAAGHPGAFAAERSVPMLPGESWWGLAAGFGRRMPFDATTDFKCDLRVHKFSLQACNVYVDKK